MRLAQHGGEQRFTVADGLLTLESGRVPKVRQVRDPLALGVHPCAAASVAGSQPERVPVYVRRDVDAELRDCLGRGGFVLLIGDSTAGKSRTAFEAVHARLSGHEFFVPGDKNIGKDVMAAIVDRIARSRRAVLWLDDLERFLRSGAITPVQIARIVGGRGHKAIVATLRGAEEDQLAQVPADADAGQRELREQAGQVLEQAQRIRLERLFSPAELERARSQVADERIADALDHASEYGIAEFLTAGPYVRDAYDEPWADDRNPRGVALVAAAVDCLRAGYPSPLPKALLEELHQDYLDRRGGQRLRPEPLEQAWAWATRQRGSATALLQPVAGDEAKVEVSGYLADRCQQQIALPTQVPDHIVRVIIGHADAPGLKAVASRLWDQGRYPLAAEGFLQEMYVRWADDGEEHPDTLVSWKNWAGALATSGRLAEAEAEQRAVLEVQRRVLGEEHPDTLDGRVSLANVLRGLGRLEESEAEYRAVLEIQRRVLGEEHLSTLVCRNNLANVLKALGRLEESEAEYRAVLEIQRRVLGEEHLSTLLCRSNLVNVLEALGRLTEAEAETERRAVLEVQRRVLGEEHPSTLVSRHNLAYTMKESGRLEEAAAEYRAVLEARRRVLGEEHRNTLLGWNELAGVLAALGRLEEAAAEYRAVLEISRRVSGEEHKDTLICRNELAGVLAALGRLEEAAAEYRAVLEISRRVSGEE
ncbi:tetratricopeptide repeat protein, partial [Microbispora sp. NPDC088329]|uniref:tetratricopeptide repeat protein n=1 Tax=Microbispora sp. NPDC088329 TaxID=3154869 RepID=UPI0034341704